MKKEAKIQKNFVNRHGRTKASVANKRETRIIHDRGTAKLANNIHAASLRNLVPIPTQNRQIALRGSEVLGLFEYLWKSDASGDSVAHERIARSFQYGDLLNAPLVLWLIVRSPRLRCHPI